jgi:hypothetical protein
MTHDTTLRGLPRDFPSTQWSQFVMLSGRDTPARRSALEGLAATLMRSLTNGEITPRLPEAPPPHRLRRISRCRRAPKPAKP